MHPKDDMLRAWIDQELPMQRMTQVQEHLNHCSACASRAQQMRARAQRVQRNLQSLAPGPMDQLPSSQAAYARFLGQSQKNRTIKERMQPMFRRKPVWAALAVIAVMAISLSLPPVRAWASSFLSLFRVERIAVIEFDPAAADGARDRVSANREAMEQVLDEYLEISGGGEVQQVGSLEEAAEAAGFTPRIPASLLGARLAVKPAMQARFTIDQPALQELANVMEADITLPPEVDGKIIQMDAPAGVIAALNCSPAEADQEAGNRCFSLIQMPSPSVETPAGLDVPAMGEAMLQFLGMSAEEARSLSQKIDWTSTLVLPIPQGKGIEASDVTVDGVTGTFITSAEEPGYMLIWVKDSVVYALRGPGGMEQALEIASSLP